MTLSSRSFFLIFSLSPLLLFAQDTSNSERVQQMRTSFVYHDQFDNTDSINSIDTSITNFQNYLPFNHLGNGGLAYNDLVYKNENFGFNYFKNNYSTYFFSPDKIRFYNTLSPYTNIFYATGSKKEQVSRLTFSANIKPNWNTTFDFNRIRSDGFYDRQNTNDNAVAISTNYKSTDNRYYLLSSLIYNSAKNAENGGVVNDSIIGLVNLNSAKRTLNEKSIFLKQYFNLGEKKGDSLEGFKIEPSSRVVLTSLFQNQIIKYEDNAPLAGYYKNYFYDDSITYDSLFNYKVENELEWKRLDNHKHRGLNDMLGISLSAKHQYIQIKQKSAGFAYNNIFLGAGIYNTYSNHRLWWNINGVYVLNGYNKDNHLVKVSLKKVFSDNLTYVAFAAENRIQSPDFIYNHYYSNNFFWNNNFKRSNASSIVLTIFLNKPKLYLGGDYSIYSDVLYFDKDAIANQYTGNIEVLKLFLNNNFNLYNWHLNNKITYQSLPSNTVIRLPELVWEHALYHENTVFKKAASLQIGVSLFYVSGYYANAYMPATGQFYLQASVKTGNYPALNFFINAKIKAVRVFFKIDHLNEGWLQNEYFLTPDNPMNPRAFKFGASWLFFD